MKTRNVKKLSRTERETINHYQGKSYQATNKFYTNTDEILAAVKQDYKIIYSASSEARGNKAIMMEALSKDAHLYGFCSKKLQKDNDIMFLALKQNGMIISSFPQEILATREDVIMAAINQNGRALQHVPLQYRQNPEIVYKTIEKDVTAFQFADTRIKSDPNFVLKVSTISPKGLKYASYELKGDIDFVTRCVLLNGTSLQYAHPRIRVNRNICILAVKQDPRAYKYIDESLKMEFELYMMSKRMNIAILDSKMYKLHDVHVGFE
jgi:hypothetical protein